MRRAPQRLFLPSHGRCRLRLIVSLPAIPKHEHGKEEDQQQDQTLIVHQSALEIIYSQGTGSYPPGCQGWQRDTRLAASQDPLQPPCLSMASIAYSEQLGWNRQLLPSSGLMARRYARTTKTSSIFIEKGEQTTRLFHSARRGGPAHSDESRGALQYPVLGDRLVKGGRILAQCAVSGCVSLRIGRTFSQ